MFVGESVPQKNNYGNVEAKYTSRYPVYVATGNIAFHGATIICSFMEPIQLLNNIVSH